MSSWWAIKDRWHKVEQVHKAVLQASGYSRVPQTRSACKDRRKMRVRRGCPTAWSATAHFPHKIARAHLSCLAGFPGQRLHLSKLAKKDDILYQRVGSGDPFVRPKYSIMDVTRYRKAGLLNEITNPLYLSVRDKLADRGFVTAHASLGSLLGLNRAAIALLGALRSRRL
jgi:hypothetical protein